MKIWHYHPELELVVILESTGTRFVGDGIEKFEPGELVLIGKNLPHMWLNDEPYFKDFSGLHAEALCVHFREDFMGQHFLEMPGAGHLSLLFKHARRGIRFLDISPSIIQDINDLTQEHDEFIKLMKLLNILYALARHEKTSFLSSEGYLDMRIHEELDKTHEFIFNNFNTPIQLADVAAVAGKNPSSFSRYFKKMHRKTFSRYLIEIRIGYACKLLMENRYNISAVCYESGFNNISNFNKQFRNIMGMNPSEYVRHHN